MTAPDGSANARTVDRTVLPIPARRHVGLVTYDAKDPDASFPPIVPLRPPERATGNGFTGRVQWVQLDIDEAAEDVDHLITPEERLSVAMARQ